MIDAKINAKATTIDPESKFLGLDGTIAVSETLKADRKKKLVDE
jgi:hypothetical protein